MLISGVFYWKSKGQFVFQNFRTKKEELLRIDPSTSQGVYELQKGSFKVHLISICENEPPQLDLALVLPMSVNPAQLLSRRNLAIMTIVLVTTLGLLIPLRRLKKDDQPILTKPIEVTKFSSEINSPLKIDQKYFYQVLKNKKQEIAECQYQYDFKDGLIKFKALINASGKVKQLLVLSEDVRSESLLKCIETKIILWKFPETPIAENTVFFALALKNE